MKLGIALIILGTIFITDASIQMIFAYMGSAPGIFLGGAGKVIIGAILLYFGIRRVVKRHLRREKGQ